MQNGYNFAKDMRTNQNTILMEMIHHMHYFCKVVLALCCGHECP